MVAESGAAMDLTQDTEIVIDSPTNGTKRKADGSPVSTGLTEVPALKVAFYELLVRQLQDDGFSAQAQSICKQLHVEPNSIVAKDSLYDAYSKSLQTIGHSPKGEWKPVVATPVPPLRPGEPVLDLSDEGAGGSTGSKAPSKVGCAISTKKPPEIRLLYTATHKQAVRTATFSGDGRTAATGCVDGTIKVLDCAKMRATAASTEGTLGRMRVTDEELARPVTRILQDHMMAVTSLAFHPTMPTLFSGSTDKAVKIFDLSRPPGHKKAVSVIQDVHPVRCIAVHPCGDFLMVGTAHQALRVYDLQTLSCFTTFDQSHHHSAGINDVSCTSDGRIYATASSDGAIRIWDAVGNKLMNQIPQAHGGSSVSNLRWSRSLRYLLSSGSDGRTRLWDVRTGSELFSMGFGPRVADTASAAFAGGEGYIVGATSNVRAADVTVFDSETGSPVFTKLGMHQMPVRAVEASPTESTFITACDDHNARYFMLEANGTQSSEGWKTARV